MLRAYKTFNTKDVEEKGSRLGSVLSSGQPLPVNKQFFKKIGRLTGEQVENMKVSVMKKEISLTQAVENAMKSNDREKTLSLVSQKLGNITSDEVVRLYSDSFNTQVLDSFRGAVLGRKGNKIGKDLEDYCDQVLLGGKNKPEPKIEVKIVNEGIIVDGKIDVAVITCESPELSTNTIVEMIEIIQKKTYGSNLVVVSKDNKGITHLKQCLEEKTRKKVTDIYFTQEKGVEQGGFEQNIYYGLTAGKVFGRAVKKINGIISVNLRKVVASLSPPSARLALFHMAKTIPLTLIHTADSSKTEYHIVPRDEQKLLSKLKNDYLVELEEVVVSEKESITNDEVSRDTPDREAKEEQKELSEKKEVKLSEDEDESDDEASMTIHEKETDKSNEGETEFNEKETQSQEKQQADCTKHFSSEESQSRNNQGSDDSHYNETDVEEELEEIFREENSKKNNVDDNSLK